MSLSPVSDSPALSPEAPAPEAGRDHVDVAVIGLRHGASYLHPIAKQPRIRLAGLVDIDAGRLDEQAGRWDVPGFDSIEAMIDAGVADTAIIALPTPLHAEASIACLEAGMNVLQEKVLCRTDEEAQAIGRAVRDSGRVFQVGYECRSSGLHQAILEHVRRGDIGQVTNIWYNQHCLEKAKPGTWRKSRANMGGKLLDCAAHFFDLIQQWAGAPVHRVAALGNTLGEIGPTVEAIPESVVVSLEYANGIRATYNFSSSADFKDDANFGIAGTTGRIMGNPWYPDKAGSFEVRRDRGARVYDCVFDGELNSRGHLGFNEQLDYFAATILDGAPNACSFEDAWAIHRQMRAIDRSIATGEMVTVGHPELEQ